MYAGALLPTRFEATTAMLTKPRRLMVLETSIPKLLRRTPRGVYGASALVVGAAIVATASRMLFLPPLALTLLYLNNRSDLIGKQHRNGPLANLVLVAAVVLFLYLGFDALLVRP